ncbi:SMI1/KNR4 family protein [Planomicrobium okeanokoites]|uniref:SMI1/KNR4 family protein n=1 Tax=Planomicrobium okeanokoites TaxID=244 RepID=UPI0030FCCB7C
MKKVIDMVDRRSITRGVSLVDLKKAEKQLGALFPDEFKDLYLETNGAQVGEWTLFSLTMVQNQSNRPEALPADMICIGENKSGDKLCYRIRKRWMQEHVYRWNLKSGNTENKSSTLYQFIEWFVPTKNAGKSQLIGHFAVESGKLVVTDPCYSIEDTEMQVHLANVKKGQWTASISYTNDETVETLTAYFAEKKPSGKWHVCERLIGVDSAQAGIFDAAVFGRGESIPGEVENVYGIELDEEGLKYYLACSDAVASDDQGGILPGGAVSMSGYGDGMYEVSIKYNLSKEIVGVKINFGDEE